MAGVPILSLITFLPLAGALLLLFVPKSQTGFIMKFATAVGLADFVLSLPLWSAYDRTNAGFQFLERHSWIPSLGVEYTMGLDGVSMLLVLLTTLLGFIAILSSWTAITDRVKEYYVFLLLLQTGMLGVFVSVDFFLFYVFWEVMLVPMYFLIGIWGGPRKLYAAIKFFLYTLFGSVLMLIGILALYFFHGSLHGADAFAACPYPGPHEAYTFDIRVFHALGSLPYTGAWMSLSYWVFLAFFLGFAIKVPMFPFHTWLPDAHVEAPTAGSVILAGVLLKMGTYGFLRFSLPIMPDATRTFMPWLLALCVIGIIYGAMVAMVQKDWKKLVAYSSVSHLGMCMIGLFALNFTGINGSVLGMINHGLATGALFLIVGLVYERRHTRMISDFGGLSKAIPIFAVFFMIATLSSIGLPGLNGFIHEFTILAGLFKVEGPWYTFLGASAKWWTVLAATGIVLGAAYMLWLYQRTMFGPLDKPENQKLQDLNFREVLTLAPIFVCCFWIGLYPKPFFEILDRPVERLVRQVSPDQATRAQAARETAGMPAAVASASTAESSNPAAGTETSAIHPSASVPDGGGSGSAAEPVAGPAHPEGTE
jgi:NADH-quinone oxidoreductase subunit M